MNNNAKLIRLQRLGIYPVFYGQDYHEDFIEENLIGFAKSEAGALRIARAHCARHRTVVGVTLETFEISAHENKKIRGYPYATLENCWYVVF